MIILLYFSGNIPGNDLSKGEVLCDYMKPFPPKGTGYHRFIFTLYKQEQHIDFSSEKRAPQWLVCVLNLSVCSKVKSCFMENNHSTCMLSQSMALAARVCGYHLYTNAARWLCCAVLIDH